LRYQMRADRLLAKDSQTAAGGPLETGARVKPFPTQKFSALTARHVAPD
jgi:hypothetical protein